MGEFALSGLSTDTAFLLCGLFALASRFAPRTLTGVAPFEEKEKYFAMHTTRLYLELQHRAVYSLEGLQGAVLLSYYSFTSGDFPQAWMCSGFCVRLAQELRLCEMDMSDAARWRRDMDWVQLEERRRVCWLLWDLDTVLSTMSRRPFAIDRRFIPMLLPVPDDVWFSELETLSVHICPQRGQIWTAFQASGNRSSYAWYLVSRYLVSLMYDGGVPSGEVSLHDQNAFIHEIMCLQLLLPVPLDLYAVKEVSSIAESNWITFAHLVLASALPSSSSSISSSSSPSTEPISGSDLNNAAYKTEQKFAVLDILSRWPSHHTACASPLTACTLMPFCVPPEKQPTSSLDMLTKNIVTFVMSQFADRCQLGSILLSKSKPS